MITNENATKFVLGKLPEPEATPRYPALKTYPLVKVALVPAKAPSGYQISIEHQASEQSEPQRHEETITLENRRFKAYAFSEITTPSNTISNLYSTTTSTHCTFTLGEREKTGLKISVTAEGKLVCEGAGMNTLTLETPNDVVLSGTVKTEHFNCTSKTLLIEKELKGKLIALKADEITIANKGTINSTRTEIQAEHLLQNKGVINADVKVKIYSNGKIINENKIATEQGTLLVEGISNEKKSESNEKKSENSFKENKVEVKLNENKVEGKLKEKKVESHSKDKKPEILNKGTIHAHKVHCLAKKLLNEKTIHAREFSGILYSKPNEISFMNDGQMTGLDLFNIETNGIAFIDSLGNCKSDQRIKIQAEKIKNRGTFSAKEVHTYSKEFHNSEKGKILSEEFVIGTTGNATNLGLIQSKDCYLFTDELGTLCNNGRFLMSGVLQATVLGNVRNSGTFAAKQLKIASGIDIIQDNRSQISAIDEIRLDSNRNTSLAGALVAPDINTRSSGCTHLSGNIKGKRIQVKSKEYLKTLAIIEGEEAIALQSEGSIFNQNHIRTKTLSLTSGATVKNESKMEAETITVDGYLIENLINGIIIACKKLGMKADVIANLNVFSSETMSLDAVSLITNKATGTINAIDAQFKAGRILSNLGKIISDRAALKSGHWIENAKDALIKANHLDAESNYSMDNFGKIESKEIYLEALKFLKNHQDGTLASDTIAEFKAWAFNNSGTVSVQNLKADVRFIIENSGKIRAEETLQLINACLIQNLGTLSSRDITLQAKEIIHNMEIGGIIEAEKSLEAIAKLAVVNSGILDAEQMHLQACQFLANYGKATAHEMKLQTDGLCLNNNLLEADILKIKADCLINLKKGLINAKEALEIFVTRNIEQHGRMVAESGYVQALNFNLTGEMTLKKLTMNIQENFNLCKEGKITAENSVEILTKNLYLLGQLMGDGRISFNIEKHFEYDHDIIWACEVLHLLIQQGFDFTKPLRSQKSIEIETAHGSTVTVQNEITTQKNLSITSGVIDILKTGTLHAGKNLLLNAFSRLTNLNEITAGWNALIKGNLFHNKGVVDIENTLTIDVSVFKNEQQTTEVKEEVIVNKKEGTKTETLIKAVPNTGVVKAQTILGKCDTFYQIGGETRSGEGGTFFVVKDKALIQALRTTNAVQGEVTRRGNNYQIEPEFIPARVTSLGNQTFIVLEGDFDSKGMISSAAGVNTANALKGKVLIKHAYEQYDLASTDTRSGFAGTKHIRTGGTDFSYLPSQFVGGEGVNLLAPEGSIEIIASLIYSGGDANIMARHLVAILNDVANTSFYNSTEKFKGFGYHTAKVKGDSTHILPSQLVICGNLNISAQKVHLRALQGIIGGDFSIEALNVLIEGAVATETVVSKNESISVDFFGSEVLESVMRGKNAREVLKVMMQNKEFANSLKIIAHSKDSGEKITEASKCFVQYWRLAAMVAHGCNETNANADVSNVCGAFTDKLGITSSEKVNGKIQRKFNPEFRFTHSKSITMQTRTWTMPTTLMIGGNLHIVGDVVKILDGAQISANNITIIANQLLEISAAKNTESIAHTSNSESASFKADSTFAGAGLSESTYFSDKTTYDNALLKARGVLTILSKGKVSLVGAELEARNVLIKANELLIKSLQDSAVEDKDSFSCSGSANSMEVKTSEESNESLKVNRPTAVRATQALEVFVNSIIQIGSTLSAGERQDIRNLMGGQSVQWQASDLHDHEKTTASKTEFSLKPDDTFPMTAFFNSKKHVKTSKTNATVAGPNVNGIVPENVNRDLNKVKENLTEERESVGVPIVIPNTAKLADDAKCIADAGKNVKDFVSNYKKDEMKGVKGDGNKSDKRDSQKKEGKKDHQKNGKKKDGKKVDQKDDNRKDGKNADERVYKRNKRDNKMSNQKNEKKQNAEEDNVASKHDEKEKAENLRKLEEFLLQSEFELNRWNTFKYHTLLNGPFIPEDNGKDEDMDKKKAKILEAVEAFEAMKRDIALNSAINDDELDEPIHPAAEFTRSVAVGAGHGILGVINTWAHPFDNVLYPMCNFIHDLTIVSAKNSKILFQMDPYGAFFGDQVILADLMKRDSATYVQASRNMQDRIDNLKDAYNYVSNARWSKKVELASEAVTSWYVPGALLKFIRTPLIPKFKERTTWWQDLTGEYNGRPIKEINTLSFKEVRRTKDKEVLMYVINENKELIITHEIYDHWQLGKAKPVYAAGNVFLDHLGRIVRIDNKSGSYAPQGKHLSSLVEESFVKHGYKDAKNKFVDFHKEMIEWNEQTKFSFKSFYKEARTFGFYDAYRTFFPDYKPQIVNDHSRVASSVASGVGLSSHSSLTQEKREQELVPLYKAKLSTECRKSLDCIIRNAHPVKYKKSNDLNDEPALNYSK